VGVDSHVRRLEASTEPVATACEACGAPLNGRQRRGARFHDGRCRATASRARRRAEVLAAIDAMAADLQRLRGKVTRW
jgi:hypothetical protein